jgi:hypothetical protein
VVDVDCLSPGVKLARKVKPVLEDERKNMAHNGFQKGSIIICHKCNCISFSTSSRSTTHSVNVTAQRNKDRGDTTMHCAHSTTQKQHSNVGWRTNIQKKNRPVIIKQHQKIVQYLPSKVTGTCIIDNCLNTNNIKSLKKARKR